MKRHLFQALALVIAAICVIAGCKQKKEEKNYIELGKAIFEKVDGQDETVFEQACADFSQLADEALSIHTDDSVAIFFVNRMYIYEILDDEGYINLVNSLGQNVRDNNRVQKTLAIIEKKATTGVGTKFIDFEIPQPDGKKMKLSDYAGNGKYCVVDMWASWCYPCRMALPKVKDIYEKYSRKDLEVVSVAVWDKVEASVDTAKAHGVCWHQILDAGSVPTELYGIEGIPSFLLISPDGTILCRTHDPEDVAEKLADLL